MVKCSIVSRRVYIQFTSVGEILRVFCGDSVGSVCAHSSWIFIKSLFVILYSNFFQRFLNVHGFFVILILEFCVENSFSDFS